MLETGLIFLISLISLILQVAVGRNYQRTTRRSHGLFQQRGISAHDLRLGVPWLLSLLSIPLTEERLKSKEERSIMGTVPIPFLIPTFLFPRRIGFYRTPAAGCKDVARS